MSMKSILALAFSASMLVAAPTQASDPRLGERVDRICFAGSISGFRVPAGYNNAVVLTRGARDRYLVELSGPGLNSLKFAQAFGIDSRGGCLTRGDRLVFSDSVFNNDRLSRTSYIITAIYRWDEKAVAETGQEDA